MKSVAHARHAGSVTNQRRRAPLSLLCPYMELKNGRVPVDESIPFTVAPGPRSTAIYAVVAVWSDNSKGNSATHEHLPYSMFGAMYLV